MQAFLVSTGVVAVSEIGDKTQLLALLLAARFKRPLPIVAGIIVATLFNHTIAGALGAWLGAAVNPDYLRWGLGALFIGMGLWALVPDTLDDAKVNEAATTVGIFWITTVAFFLAEMGDKTQLATAALAARFAAVVQVVAGTTLGMLIADVPAVFLGHLFSEQAKGSWVRYVAAAIFIALGVATLVPGLLPAF
ncbi:MAG: TMEM165/GDT1 family protein [Rhodospirillaceae bacterium]|nr:TMEM165/GDT1 family protein [Rhodospirillaceae bacterium]